MVVQNISANGKEIDLIPSLKMKILIKQKLFQKIKAIIFRKLFDKNVSKISIIELKQQDPRSDI